MENKAQSQSFLRGMITLVLSVKSFFFFCFVTSVVFRIFFFPFSNVLSFVKLKFKTYLAGLAINSFLENQVLTQLQRVEILSEMKISYTL